MDSLALDSLPAPLSWMNVPVQAGTDGPGHLHVAAGAGTDWFVDPAGGQAIGNAPVALFTPPDKECLLSARVTVEFAATFDAGVLFVLAGHSHWAKLCFEFTPRGQPSIVTVVTRGVSDDCNSVLITGNSVYLRIFRRADLFAFHYSTDGRFWHLARYFALGAPDGLQLGFESQSPTGSGCRTDFTEISYRAGSLDDIRNGS